MSASVEATSSGSGKQVFTTGEAARLCNLSQQTIIRCFDAGRVRGYRVPGSKTRRIPRGELVRFMRSHNMPLDVMGESDTVLLVVEDDLDTVQDIRRVAEAINGYSVHVASTAYEAGVLTAKLDPQVLVMNTRLPDLDVLTVCRSVRIANGEPGTTVILLANKYRSEELQECKDVGIKHFLRKPIDDIEFSKVLMSAVNA
ncbi:MAG: response regulator [Phycisphaerales bacterium]|nr:response regulator [Phycisphaerales bacterium]